MKNVFGTDINIDRGIDGEKFIIREPDASLSKKMNDCVEGYMEFNKQVQLPLWLTIIYYIALFVGSVCFISILKAVVSTPIETILKNGFWIILVAVVSWTVLLILFLYKKAKKAHTIKSGTLSELEEESEKLYQTAMEVLKVPKDAKQVDVFMEIYKVKDEKKKSTNELYTYTNFSMSLFVEDNALCLANADMVMSFALDWFKRVVPINKKAIVSGWNKEEPFNKGEFKQYKIKANQFGVLLIKPFYSLQLNDGIENFEILIPPYDIEHFLAIIGLPISEP